MDGHRAEQGHQMTLSMFTKRLVLFLTLGIAIRLVLMIFCTFSFDMSFWTGTGESLEGGRSIYDATFYNYTPVWGYVISVMTAFGNLIGLSDYGNLFQELVSSDSLSTIPNVVITTFEASVLFKLPLLMFDILTAFVLYGIVDHMTGNRKKSETAFALWFLCPLVIWSSGVAGMFESLCVLFTLLGFYFLVTGKYHLSGPAFVLAVLTKIFPVCLLFAVIGYLVAKERGNTRELRKSLFIFFTTGIAMFLVIYAPLVLNGDVTMSFGFLSGRYNDLIKAPEIGGGFSLSYNSIIYLAPFFSLILIALGIYLSRSDLKKVDNTFVMVTVISFTLLFMWPPTPTYPVVLIPFLAMAITICSEKRLLISWALVSVIMTLAALMIFNIRIFYTLGAYTDIFDLSGLISSYWNYNSFFEQSARFLNVLEFIPGISVMLIFVIRYITRKGEVVT